MPELPINGTVEPGGGITIVSTGVQAEVPPVELAPPGVTRGGETLLQALTSDFVSTDPSAAQVLATNLTQSGLALQATVQLDNIQAPQGPPDSSRGGSDAPRLSVSVPAPGQDQSQVFLEVDRSGLVMWHLPEPQDSGSTVRGDDTQLFVIPIVPLPAGEESITSGDVWRKALHLLRFDRIVAKVGSSLIADWEEEHRPHQLLNVGSSALIAGDALLHPIGPGWFTGKPDKPYLLLVHGTFSTTADGFSGLLNGSGWFEKQLADYHGRVIAFDHPTLHVSPDDNAFALLSNFPTDRPLQLDIVCHSRGGLVSRRLLAPEIAAKAGVPVPKIGKLVFVATPNRGTPLAQKARWNLLFTVFTNVLSFFPTSTSATTLKAVIQAIKQVGTGLLDALPGLSAMDPDAALLNKINKSAAPAGTYAISSNFEPVAGAHPINALDVLVDAYFAMSNDLVVPTEGVAQANHYVVPPERRSSTPETVWHSGYFHEANVRTTVTAWLAATS